jgi:glycosyltransferase involved in cell wall biosynthesis
VHFVGWIGEAEQKARYYAAADCLVLASWREGFPSVIGEAIACGTPVISSRVGAVDELVIEGETGWLFEPGDDAELTKLMARLIANPEIAVAMRPRARALAEERISHASVAAKLRCCFEPESGGAR